MCRNGGCVCIRAHGRLSGCSQGAAEPVLFVIYRSVRRDARTLCASLLYARDYSSLVL
jgi:hypothetical protein